MGKVSLYIGMSLDGFIADRDGGVDWLVGQDMVGNENEEKAASSGEAKNGHGENKAAGQDNDNDYDSYGEFIKTVSTVLMGWRTYRQVREELAPGAWPYQGLRCYVFTHREQADKPAEDIYFVQEEPAELVKRLRQGQGDVWLCGGADIARQAMAADLVDRWQITVIPTILGAGVRLFGEQPERRLRLLETREYQGIVELVYERR